MVEIAIFAYTHQIVIAFGIDKLEWCGYPMVNKTEVRFIRFDIIHEHDRHPDRQTDGRTPHDGIDRV